MMNSHLGRKNLITDVPGLLVGNAQDARLKSGVTVLTADAPFIASVSIVGGAPGTRDVALLEADKTVQMVDALVLSGGSGFGLDAASGVTEGLRAQGRGFAVGPAKIPLAPSAILFDLLNGGEKDWDRNPYAALGLAAYRNAGEGFDLGSIGAGCGALTGQLKGGLGSASVVLESGITVGALVAVNPFGCVTAPDAPQFWAAPFEVAGEFGNKGPVFGLDPLAAPQSRKMEAFNSRGNTTIAIVATDAALTKPQAKRVAMAAHDGLARAIVPSHTPVDGDLVFAAATGQRPLNDEILDVLMIGHFAAVALARACARAVFHVTPQDNDVLPTWHEKWG